MQQLPKILSVKTQVQSRLYKIESVDLEFSNGVKTTYERIDSSRDAVMVIPFDGENFIFSKEYCVGTEKYELGFTKGKIDEGESALEAAHRELGEELGIGAKEMIHLRTITFAPGFMKFKMHIYLALDLFQNILDSGDEPEPIQKVKISYERAKELLENSNSQLQEPRCLVGLMHAFNILNKN